MYQKAFGQAFQMAWGAGLTAPLFEELGKGSGVLLLLFLAPRVVRTAYDGFILGAFVGLGFEILEDISCGYNSASEQFGSDQMAASLSTVGMRLVTGFSSHISTRRWSVPEGGAWPGRAPSTPSPPRCGARSG
ncbi:MAG TPA: PrsW family glutamic-type intramembrane protease [Actinoplanes sp.]|nr:PrsW family glutamic-type intramembrane protease [Actinoplanes sp.]